MHVRDLDNARGCLVMYTDMYVMVLDNARRCLVMYTDMHVKGLDMYTVYNHIT